MNNPYEFDINNSKKCDNIDTINKRKIIIYINTINKKLKYSNKRKRQDR